ncbi:MAG TPA: TetR family transcriptional regulator C-terminal domain-containing protein, partial [Amaricoccus sp.]|nr:TetR family transcriptional regulator C-terminal domain-containing protein [Amaricoccus sp.]
MTRAASRQNPTRIQREKTEAILAAALEVFSANGFRGATLDQIAETAGISKPNLLYYFACKEDVHRMLLERLLDTWLEPLRQLDPAGEPAAEIGAYIRRKLEMARDYPRESRLFAGEILQGAPHIADLLAGPLRELVDAKAGVIAGWAAAGRIAPVDPRHLIVTIWAVTQHYADFDAQLDALFGPDE